MNQTEREKLARMMGIAPAAYEKFRRDRAGAVRAEGTTSSIAARAAAAATPAEREEVLAASLDRDRLCKAFGIKPADFLAWKQKQAEEGRRLAQRGEPLTLTMHALIDEEASPVAPTPITPTAEERALFERGRQSSSVAALEQVFASAKLPARSGLAGTMKMISRALTEDRNR